MLADRVDGKGNTGDGEHGGNDAVRRGGGCPGVGGGKVHGHLVDLDSLNQTDADLRIRRYGQSQRRMIDIQQNKRGNVRELSKRGHSKGRQETGVALMIQANLQKQQPGSFRAMHR